MPLVATRSPSTNRYTPLQKDAQYMHKHLFLEPGRSECICHVPLVEPYSKKRLDEIVKVPYVCKRNIWCRPIWPISFYHYLPIGL